MLSGALIALVFAALVLVGAGAALAFIIGWAVGKR